MNPLQKNKVDVSSLSEEEQKLFRLYGKLPNKKDLLQNKLKSHFSTSQERKYFDSGDYALSKAGKASEGGVTSIGSQHPLPENIPHLTSPVPTTNGNGGNGHSGSISHSGSMSSGSAIPGGQSGSPVKEASFLHRGESVDEQAVEDVGSKSPPAKEGVPSRWQ
ncbi:MAG: hypothetical protein L6R40_002727 [Gallowayella cf. fulva]|nr:MAG: hypothetical protein L6R40_002727 [Xanthomendoza cf. fulva]